MNENEEDSEKLIDMESPLFEIISKTQNFENNYAIYISQENIDENNIKDDYKIKFDNLNKSNIEYSSIYFKFNNKKKIKYLEELNIDYNKIKRLKLIEGNNEEENENDNNYKSLLKFKKLEILNLSYNKIKNINILEKVNFKELKQLELS